MNNQKLTEGKANNRNSKARLKFWGLLITCWILVYPITTITDPLLNWIFFIVYAVGCICIALIRCENCGVLLYRYDSKEHGMPNVKLLNPVTHCPKCGIKRL